MADGKLDGQELPEVRAVSLLAGRQGLGPEPKGTPRTINPLVQACSQASLGGVRREGEGSSRVRVVEENGLLEEGFGIGKGVFDNVRRVSDVFK